MRRRLLAPALFLALLCMRPAQASALAADLATKGEILMALIESRVTQVPNVENTGAFPDVRRGHRYERYLIIAEKYGIITPDKKTKKLYPDRPVSRAEFLRMAAFTFGLPSGLSYLYTDILPGDWFADYAGIAQQYALFPGDRDTEKLRPGKLVTRAEATQAVRQVLRKQREKKPKGSTTKSGVFLKTSSAREKVIISEADGSVKRVTIPAAANDAATVKARSAILRLINDIRAEHDLEPLTMNAALELSAQDYAEEIAQLGFFSHVSPSGGTLKERILATGYVDIADLASCDCLLGYAFAENLARGQTTPEEAVDAWMNSAGHRENILNPLYQEIGIGVKGTVWVQHFGGILTPEE